VTPADRARVERASQGLGEHVEDEAALDLLAQLLAGSEHDGGGAGAMTPPPLPTQSPSPRSSKRRAAADAP
jgi:hypothetical protein